MGLYVYITPECEKDADKHNRYEEMLKFKGKVEQAQRICMFDNFPPPYLKKRFDRQIRLLADYRTLTIGEEKHTVVCFLRIFIRSSKEYVAFLNKASDFGDKYLQPLIDEERLETFIRDQLRENPVQAKPEPSETEHHFLFRFMGQDSNLGTDQFICESERFVRVLGEERIKAMSSQLFDELSTLVPDTSGKTETKVRQYTLVYRWFDDLRKLFVAGLAETLEEVQELKRIYKAVFSRDEAGISEELVLKHSMRTYPAIILADENSWQDIQKDAESNLALSPEEVSVLESVRGKEGFPIFINGRAGSGKSTILHYLFADYVNLYLELNDSAHGLFPPLLLSCSEELKRRGQNTVQNLIKNNPKWRKETGATPSLPTVSFQEFHSFLLNLVPEDDETRRFDQSRFIDYSRFRHEWNKQFAADKKMRAEIGSDLSWHIIRSYIKGSSPENYLDSDDYKYLPRGQRSVSEKAYKTVYEKVWENWYQPFCDENGYWDDQDLARYIFEHDLVKSVYPAVFCDEAQDFTRVELDLIFRLCLFVERKLDLTAIKRVPFAFAGDPFQTLNPTGFRWDAIRASFHDKLLDTLGENLYRDKDIGLNYQELNLNYRSTKNIVKLCNSIQALRAALFDITDLKPQRTWQMEEDSPMPVWFDKRKLVDWQQLENEKDITIIVPCMLNEEKDYVQKDEHLSRMVRKDESGVPLNVLSPARAKGLEFGRVVLYGFADSELGDLVGLLDEQESDPDRRLPIEYFVNQLYVGSSRPKKRLFIIDSQEGLERLWKIANDESLQEKIWKKISKGKRTWEDAIGGFHVGTKNSWGEDRGDPLENAKQMEQQGLAMRDPFMLRQAALQYESIEQPIPARMCRAHALKYEERFEEAGRAFQEAGADTDALQCFWQGGLAGLPNVLRLVEEYPGIMNRPERHLAYHHQSIDIKQKYRYIFEFIGEFGKSEEWALRLESDETLGKVIWAIIGQISRGTKELEAHRRNIKLAKLYVNAGMKIDNEIYGNLHYAVGDDETATALWEKCKRTSSEDYKKAKHNILINKYEKEGGGSLSENERIILANYYLEKKRYIDYYKLIPKTQRVDALLGILGRVPSNYPQWREMLVELMRILAARGEWDLILDFGAVGSGSRLSIKIRNIEKVLKKKTVEIRDAIVAVCATSDSLIRLGSRDLKRFSDYFRKELATPARWMDILTVEAAGGATERAGRHIDILPFYESVFSTPGFTEKEKEFARKRWIATKEKQAIREEEQGNRGPARKHMDEAEQKRREYGISDAKLAEYPNVAAIWSTQPRAVSAPHVNAGISEKETVPADTSEKKVILKKRAETLETPVQEKTPEKPHERSPEKTPEKLVKTDSAPVEQPTVTTSADTITFDLEGFRIQYSLIKGRININEIESMHSASIITDRPAFRSQDVEIVRKGDLYTCEQWGMKCDFTKYHKEGTVRLAFLKLDITMEFHFPLA